MSRLTCIALFLLLTFCAPGQETGPIALRDSIKVGPHYPVPSMLTLIDTWTDYTALHHGKLILQLADPNQTYNVGFNASYPYEKDSGKYYKGGQLTARSPKSKLKTAQKSISNGNLSFNLIVGLSDDYLTIAFTDFSYFSDNNEIGHLEDPQLLSNDGVHYLTAQQASWDKIKKDSLKRMQLLASDLKRFLAAHYRKPEMPILMHEHW